LYLTQGTQKHLIWNSQKIAAMLQKLWNWKKTKITPGVLVVFPKANPYVTAHTDRDPG
jgi:hypothetical protein